MRPRAGHRDVLADRQRAFRRPAQAFYGRGILLRPGQGMGVSLVTANRLMAPTGALVLQQEVYALPDRLSWGRDRRRLASWRQRRRGTHVRAWLPLWDLD